MYAWQSWYSQWHLSGTSVAPQWQAVLSVAPQWHVRGTSVAPQWHLSGSRGTLSGTSVAPRGVAPRGVSPRGVSRAATPSQLSRPSGELDNLVLPTLCGRVRSDASVGCSGHAQRHRFGPALRLRQSAVVKRHFPPAKSFIRAGVTTRGHRFQPRIPPGSLYSKPYNLTADRQQSCLPHSSCLPALSSQQELQSA